MKTFEYTIDQGNRMECPFEGVYCNEIDIGYHGTSNLVEAEIEKDGFIWKDGSYSRSELQRVIDVFDQLHWYGISPDGLGVLDGYTQYDFNLSKCGFKKPISFAVESRRALLYASKIRAGGETSNALRIAFLELDQYLTNPEFRQEQIWTTWKSMRDYVQGPDLPDSVTPESVNFGRLRSLWSLYRKNGINITKANGKVFPKPVEFSEEWLSEKLDKLRQIKDRSDKFFDNFEYGLVYAVKFCENDPCRMRGRIEIIADEVIPPDRILAKAIIPKEFKYRIFNTNLCNRPKFRVVN